MRYMTPIWHVLAREKSISFKNYIVCGICKCEVIEEGVM